MAPYSLAAPRAGVRPSEVSDQGEMLLKLRCSITLSVAEMDRRSAVTLFHAGLLRAPLQILMGVSSELALGSMRSG